MIFITNATKVKESNRKIKIRKQGHSHSVTVPYDFHVPENQMMKPVLMTTGIYYESIPDEVDFFDFDVDILNDILAGISIPMEKIAETFAARKAKLPQAIKEFTEEGIASAVKMSEEEFKKELDL